MKNKMLVIMAMTLLSGITAYGQEVDDMYFNSSDRAKLVANKPISNAVIPMADNSQIGASQVNPTDSYSGRGENPEYTQNSNSSTQDPSYFDSSYKPQGTTDQSNCNCGSSGYNGYGMNSMYSPYGGMYSPYSSMYGSSMYGSSMYGMGGFGSPYSSFGMGYGMGYGYPYGSSMSMMFGFGSGYGSSFGMGYGMGMYGMGYPYGYGYNNVYIVNDASSGVTYGKRGSRSSNMNNAVSYTRPAGNISSSRGSSTTGGRVNESKYYQSGWRSNPNTNPSGFSTGSGSRGSSNTWGGGSGSRSTSSPSWGNSGSSWGGGGHSFGGGGGFSGGGGGGGRGRH